MPGRNDPCPCGSGKKYKKCCARKDRIQETAARKMKVVDETIDAETTIYSFYKEWVKAVDRGDFNFVYDLCAESSQARADYGARQDFIENCMHRRSTVPGMTKGELLKIRFDGEALAQIIVRRPQERIGDDGVRLDRIVARHGDDGWRVHRVDSELFEPDQIGSSVDIELFPAIETPAAD